MNFETIAFRPEGRASIKDVVVNYTLASLDELGTTAPGAEFAGAPVNCPWWQP